MKALDYILNAIEAELVLESELGVRIVDFDRESLKPIAGEEPALEQAVSPEPRALARSERLEAPPAAAPRVVPPAKMAESESAAADLPDFAFLHDKPLAGEALAMIETIISKLGKDSSSAPISYARPFPKAKSYIVLGGNALKKFFPGKKAFPGNWIKSDRGEELLISYSPLFILGFTKNSPEQVKIKKGMWRDLQAIPRHLAAAFSDR